jgi:glycosyltransferase involved in cell wall biosynthesis
LLPEAERPILRLRGPDWRGRKRSVRAMAEARGVDGDVAIGMAAYGPAKISLLCGAQAFVYPSRWDACPNSVLEAVSLGIPTLTTPYPLGRYLAGRGGVVLAEADPPSLAEGLRVLLAADSGRIGANGAQVAREFSWPRVAESWLRQVEACL